MQGTYKPASGSGGKCPWRVVYRPSSNPGAHREIVNAAGNIIRYRSYEAAKKRADELNRLSLEPVKHPRYGHTPPDRN